MHFCSFKLRSVPKAFLFSLVHLIALISTKSFRILFFSFNPFFKSLLFKVLYMSSFFPIAPSSLFPPQLSPLYCLCPQVIHFSIRKSPNSIVEIAFCHLLHVLVYLQEQKSVYSYEYAKCSIYSCIALFIIALFLYKQL